VIDLAYARAKLLPLLAERHFGSGEPAYNLAVMARDDPSRVVWRSTPDVHPPPRGDAAAGLLELRLREAAEEDPRTGRWTLLAAHRAGSVDAVVTEARRWNLGVGFGILVLLGTSAVLVAVSAQRASHLAFRQMEFVAGVSHELRTPIAVISSAAENLADGLVEPGDQVKRYGSLVRDEASRLSEMVEQVLEFGASARGATLRRERVDVEALIDRSLEGCGAALAEGDFVVERQVGPGLPELRGDAGALVRALRNLLVNAVKHAAEGRFVGIRASAEAGAAFVLLSVEDHGVGIPAAEIPRVFDPFFRGQHAQRQQVRGFGLGLALVSRVAQAHGGGVSVSSTPGRGSVFTLRLPAGPPEDPGPERP
jgi:signal transduction histidine kinase